MQNPITFRLLTTDDVPMMHDWLNRAHLRQHYQPRPITLGEVAAKFAPRLEFKERTYCHIALLAGQPFAYIQCYKNADYPDYSAEVVLEDGISLDLFIADEARRGQGLGPQLLQAYLRDVVFDLFPDETCCYICHKLDNPQALRASQKAGFRVLRDVIEAEAPARLLVFDKTRDFC